MKNKFLMLIVCFIISFCFCIITFNIVGIVLSIFCILLSFFCFQYEVAFEKFKKDIK